MSNGDIRENANPFPYGSMYDRGISLRRVTGLEGNELGLTVGQVYVAITLYPGYQQYANAVAGNWGDNVGTIYIRASLFKGLVTIRLGRRFEVAGLSHIRRGQVVGVTCETGLIGVFSLESFPSAEDASVALVTVFDEVLTAETAAETAWAGEQTYTAAVTGSPLYYFVWDATAGKLDGPVRRVLHEDVGGEEAAEFTNTFGVFVPYDEGGLPMSPIPAFFTRAWDGLGVCQGYINYSANVVQVLEDGTLDVGELSMGSPPTWGDHVSLSGVADAPTNLISRKTFSYKTEFPTAYDTGKISGYFYVGWYNPDVDVDDPLQNSNHLQILTQAELSAVYLLDAGLDGLDFSGGTLNAPNSLWLNLEPDIGQTASMSTELVFSTSQEELTADGSASVRLAYAWSGVDGSNIVECSGQFADRMWITVLASNTIRFKALADGSSDGQYLVWDEETEMWGPGAGATGALQDGTTDGQLLVWNAGSTAWTPGPAGTAAGQLLTWDMEAGWIAGDASGLPPATVKDTLFFDGTGGTVGEWTANSIVQWEKVNGASGGNLVLDLSAVALRDWSAPMPGIVMKHPAGGTCGLFANVESGTNSGPRLDMGWGGTGGGNFELYSKDHPTRSGEFRVIYGASGHIEFNNYRGGSDWEVTAGLTKEGRFFCGFNDTGFPGGTSTYITYPAPAYPFQVFNEASHASKMTAGIAKEGRAFLGLGATMPTGAPNFPLEIYNESTTVRRVAGITKEGRGFFGLGGALPTGSPEHPVEVYNESATGSARMAYISKTGMIRTAATDGDGLAHAARLDCADIAMTTGATAQAIQLREVIMPYDVSGTVKGKKTQVMCGVAYGPEIELGLPPNRAADKVLATDSLNALGWRAIVALTPEASVPAGADGIQGIQGEPGINGTNGTNGTDGVNGTDATVAAQKSCEVVNVGGVNKVQLVGDTANIAIGDWLFTSSADARSWKKLGANGGLAISTTTGATGFRLAGTTDSAPQTGAVWGRVSSTAFGWISPIIVRMN